MCINWKKFGNLLSFFNYRLSGSSYNGVINVSLLCFYSSSGRTNQTLTLEGLLCFFAHFAVIVEESETRCVHLVAACILTTTDVTESYTLELKWEGISKAKAEIMIFLSVSLLWRWRVEWLLQVCPLHHYLTLLLPSRTDGVVWPRLCHPRLEDSAAGALQPACSCHWKLLLVSRNSNLICYISILALK